MHNGPRLQALIAEYGQLRRLDGHTPQSRGQAFNDLIADMLRCWGHRAESSVFAKGEADVVFRIGEVRYVLEAKWENRSADTGYIAKLQRRLRQRFAGTPGVFLSMGGYSPDALAEIADGEQLQVLLMDATHFEAMLSGLVPPKELFTQLHDRASFYGEPYVPLLTLIGSSEDPPSVAFGTPDMMPDGLVTDTNAVVTGEVLFTLPTSLRLGVGIDPQGHVLVTTDQGILAVDIQSRRSRWAVSVAECHGNPVVRADGAVLFTRRHGVGRLANNQVTVIGGGLFGTTRLAPHPDGTVWAFASGGTDGRSGASITRLGDKLGDEERHSLAYPSDAATTSAWIDHDDLLTIGPELLITTVATAQLRRHRAAQANATGLVSIGDGTVITSGDNVTLGRTDLLSGRFSHLADLGLRPAAHELCTGHEGTLLIAAHYGNGMETPIAVGRIALTAPSETTTRNVIENRDADALAGGPSLCGPPRRLVQQQLTFDLDTLSKTVTARDLPARSAQHRPPVTDETPVDPAPTDLREPTVVDVFAGSGGVTLGFVQEGYRPIFAVDFDLAAATTYAANFGESLTYRGDIQNVESRGLGHADVFIGAPPTRGFTGWGRARGSDPRNTLWKEFWRVVVEARPTVFAIVTTPQFLRSHEFEAMLQTIDQERSTAFRLTYGVVQAADFGVAQDRRHAVIIGSQTDGIPLPVPTHGGRHGLPRVTVHNALGGLAAPEVHVWDFPTDTTNLLGQHVHGTFRSHHLHVGRRVTLLSQQRYQHIPPGGDVRDLPDHLLSPHYLRRGPRAAAAGDLGRMRWDAPAPAIRVEFLKPEKG